MFANDFNEDDQPRRSPKRNLSWLFLLAGVLVAGAGLLFAWQIVLHSAATTPASQSAATKPQSTSVSGKASPANSSSSGISPQGPPPTPLYYQTFEQQFAQGLHMTVPQVKARLQSGSPSLFKVAESQGLTAQQANTLVINALREAGKAMVQTHVWTQQQADADLQTWQQRDQGAVDGGATKMFSQY